MNPCARVRRQLSAYVDGELDPVTHVQIEEHTATCAECLEHLLFERSFRVQLRSVVEDVQAPRALVDRVRESLAEVAVADQGGGSVRSLTSSARWVLPVVAAAAAVLVVWPGGVVDRGQTTAATLGPMLQDVVRLHSSALPSDVPEAREDRVQRYFQGKVEFPVRPARFESGNVRLVGARLSHVREQRAAALFYDAQGHRLTVVVFERPAARLPTAFERPAGGLFYQDVHGYTVPVRSHAGLEYAFAGDLDRHALLELAASARVAE